ncbi:hypothetical protein EV356DRAFT_262795 [Viridothelium virens]|uniref:Uncharacterized protein n=1 Tax=Viridothelium virens TaxID=1048519 RepID=A0A6A6HK48_VIRVR|nr:hypothetical protein EV356DRAFT_262795 [Viridothelium virens]
MSSQMRLFRSISHQQQSPPSLASEEYIGDQNSNRRLGFVKRHATEKKCDFNSGQRGITKRLKLAFLAPPWLSRTALLATIDQLSQSFLMGMGPRVTLQPITVNHSPKLLEALHRLDLLQLKQLFETNRARPNDMVMDIRMNEPVTLFEALLGTFVGFSPCSNVLSKHEELLSFLIDQGAPGSYGESSDHFLLENVILLG